MVNSPLHRYSLKHIESYRTHLQKPTVVCPSALSHWCFGQMRCSLLHLVRQSYGLYICTSETSWSMTMLNQHHIFVPMSCISKRSVSLCILTMWIVDIFALTQLPDSFQDFVMEHVGGDKSPNDSFFTYCYRKLFHAQWKDILDYEFLHAYEHGIILACGDGFERQLHPRIFTYSADYSEKYYAWDVSIYLLLTYSSCHQGTHCKCPQPWQVSLSSMSHSEGPGPECHDWLWYGAALDVGSQRYCGMSQQDFLSLHIDLWKRICCWHCPSRS